MRMWLVLGLGIVLGLATLAQAQDVGDVPMGEIGDPQEFEWLGRWYRVQYFLIRMTSESDETDGREKAWFSFDEALDRISFTSARDLLRQARKKIEALES